MIHKVGPVIGYGFITISAASNFLFAYSLANSNIVAFVYGAVGVLATIANAYIPLRMLEANDAGRTSVLIAGGILLPFCVTFSLVSALGFAASVRDSSAGAQAGIEDNYKITQQQLKDAEAHKKPDRKLIDKLRNELKAYNSNGAQKQSDPQSSALAVIGITNGRFYVNFLFALLVEIGASLGLYVALADMRPPPTIQRSWA